MLFEYADGGTLCEHLQKYSPKLTWSDKYKLGVEITDGLMYLHSLDIIHKNLVCINYTAFLLNCYINKFDTNLDAYQYYVHVISAQQIFLFKEALLK